ncbi:MAG: dihydropteroate synthase [Thermoprotei archaeon]|nr:MAG: dihydropteroate synthase [Thermoprotei archaeon]
MTKIYGKLGPLDVGDDYPVRVVGVINVSPESFYKGSVRITDEEILKAVEEIISEGCDVIDVGGRSTAPYLRTEIPIEEEVRRVVRALELIKSSFSDVVISVDTFRAKVAEEALKRGADIINDVTGLRGDPKIINVIKEYEPSLIVCAKEIEPCAGEPIDRVINALKQTLNVLNDIGYDLSKVVIDPCIGFFRYKEIPWYIWDLKVIANLDRLRILGRPIMVGISRKSFIGVITGRERPEDRLYGSIALTSIAIAKGAHIIRTHDVKETRDAIKAIEAFKKYGIKLKIKYP